MLISGALVSVATPDLPRLQHFYQALLGILLKLSSQPRGSRCMWSFVCQGCGWAFMAAVTPTLLLKPGR